MNVDVRISTKYYHTKFKLSRIYYWNVRMIQHMKIEVWCNEIHHINRMKAKKTHMVISINAEKAFDTIQNFHDKGTQQTRNVRKCSQHNKDNMQKIHGDHHIQRSKTESSSSKIGHEVRILTLATLFNIVPEVRVRGTR